jgi:cell wall assembly regulator SMI1
MLLRWHDGQKEELMGAFYETFHLMSATAIAEEWLRRKTNPEEGWNPAWIPFLDDFQEDLIVLDTSQPNQPIREVWRGRTDHVETAASLEEWLTKFIRDVENGQYHEDPERGEFIRLQARV